MTGIKICGLKRREDIEAVNLLKPDFAGFIVDYPRSHRSIGIETLKTLSAFVDRSIIRVGVFVDYTPKAIIDLLLNGVIDYAQLHGNESEETIRLIKDETGRPVIKSFHVNELERAEDTYADYPLFDNLVPGSGISYDSSILKGFPRRFFLAGGVSEYNAITLIEQLHPYALDASSSVETDKLKDKGKMTRLINLVRSFNGNR